MSQLRSTASRVRSRLRQRRVEVAFRGWPAAPGAPRLDCLTDEQLAELNDLLPWACFTTDGLGRRFGDVAWAGKRDQPQPVPDPRIVRLDELVGLRSKRVLEVGCFEGVHTMALCERAGSVIAVDSRVANVVKTIVRTSFYGHRPDVRVVDLDTDTDLEGLECDVAHHVGVLYHLREPVPHLLALGRVAKEAVWLDTHVARDDDGLETGVSEGISYRYRRFVEGADPFSGMHDHAKWLPVEDLERVLQSAGFAQIEVLERRDERNGLRVLVLARR